MAEIGPDHPENEPGVIYAGLGDGSHSPYCECEQCTEDEDEDAPAPAA